MGFIFVLVVVVFFIIVLYVYWKKFLFYRDPRREIPSGNSILSPADGTVVYIKKFSNSRIPVSVKKGKKIKLSEITHIKENIKEGYLIGIFMNPLSVHVNRSPVNGKMVWNKHFKHSSKTMIKFLLKVIFRVKASPGERFELENERNVIYIKGKIPVYVIQIADSVVNKVVCWIKSGDKVVRGQKIGMIRMGSQVDLILPLRYGKKRLKILVKEGQYIHAGTTEIANALQ